MNTVDLVKKYNHIFHTDYTADANCKVAWLFTEGSGTTVDNAQGNASYDGAFLGSGEPAWSDTVPTVAVSHSADFDGIDDTITSGSVVGLAGDMSLVSWIRLDAMPASQTDADMIYTFRNAPYHHNYYLFIRSYYTEYCYLRAGFYGSTWKYLSGATHLSVNSTIWYHCVFTFNNTTKKVNLYLNGSTDVAEGTWTGEAPESGGVATGIGLAKCINGLQTETAIFDRVLTSTEINDIMDNGLKPSVAGAVRGFMTCGKYW